MAPLVARTPPRRSRRRPLVAAFVLALVAAAVPGTLAVARARIVVEGPRSGAMISKAGLASLGFYVRSPDVAMDRLRVYLDGSPMAGSADGDALLVAPIGLRDGRHWLAVEAPGRLPFAASRVTRSFTVDTSPPALSVSVSKVRSLHSALRITGRVGSEGRLTADGQPVRLVGGRFQLNYRQPPAAVRLVATDAAGNVTARDIGIPVNHPPMRGVHLTAVAWSTGFLREPVLAMARAGRIDTVEVDVKDEGGVVGYDSGVPLAQLTGAAIPTYDVRTMLDELHSMGVRVVGRIVCFRDPELAQWAWSNGHRDWVIQGPDGAPYKSRYGEFSFTNFASPAVRQYNIDLATEAAQLGFDDILYDYVRRPDGALTSMRFPGSRLPPEKEVADFVRASHGPVRAAGSYLGLSVFGIAVTRPSEIAQDVGLLGRYADYVAPMVYPSHWGRGEYGVADPNASPYEIVRRSLADFHTKLAGSGTTVTPWLQDFSLGRHYGPEQVRAQIDAAAATGANGFLLWNASARYSAGALSAGS
ncbi:MAG: putative glycoside hydrolase [Mycobacteriales bacterium]